MHDKYTRNANTPEMDRKLEFVTCLYGCCALNGWSSVWRFVNFVLPGTFGASRLIPPDEGVYI
jgi:hypothetical protein